MGRPVAVHVAVNVDVNELGEASIHGERLAARRRRASPAWIGPQELLEDATHVTGKGVTATVIEGLDELRKRERRMALRRLKGRVRF